MKIQNIKKQKDGKYKLKLDNNSSVITYDNVILDNNLLFDSNVDSDKLDKIKEESTYYDIYNQVLKYTTKKLRSKKEIEEYLKSLSLSDGQYKDIMNKLTDCGIINDNMYARAYIHDRMEFSNDGPFKIKEELLNHNIDNSVIDEEFSKIDYSIFEEKCEKIIRKKIQANHKYSISLLKRKISNELFLLGFNIPNIDEYFDNDESDALNKEYYKLNKKYSLKYKGEELKNILFQKLYIKGFDKENIKKILNI